MMNASAYPTGGGFGLPLNGFPPQQQMGYPPPMPTQFPSVMDAVTALPLRLNRIPWAIYNRYGISMELGLGNLLGELAFVGQGVANVRDIKGDSMPLSAIVHVLGVSASGKSTAYRCLKAPIDEAMADFLHQWEFDGATPQGIKREAPVLAFNGHEDGGTYLLESPMGREFVLQIQLRDGFIPAATRAKADAGGGRKTKAPTRFTTVVNIQPDWHQEWLDKYVKKALSLGYIQRVWMIESPTKIDKSAIGRYPQAEGGLEDWSARVAELLMEGKGNATDGFKTLCTMDVAIEASHVLNHAQDRYDQMAVSGPLLLAPALAARYHEIASVLAALFQLYENGARVVTLDVMRSAIVVADFLIGQWLSIVFPPAPPPQDEQDAGMLLPLLHAELRGRGVPHIRESEVVTLAKNRKWGPTRTRAALMNLYAAGYFHLAPRTINGRAVDMIELPTYQPPPPSQLELDAGVLLPFLHAELRSRSGHRIGESEVVTLAKNRGWAPARTKVTLRALYAAGHFRLVSQTIEGRAVEMIELPTSSPRLV